MYKRECTPLTDLLQEDIEVHLEGLGQVDEYLQKALSDDWLAVLAHGVELPQHGPRPLNAHDTTHLQGGGKGGGKEDEGRMSEGRMSEGRHNEKRTEERA